MKVRMQVLNDDDSVVVEKTFMVNFGATDGQEVDKARIALANVLQQQSEIGHEMAAIAARGAALETAALAAKSNIENAERAESANFMRNALNWMTEQLRPHRERELLAADEAKLAARKAGLEKV